MSQCFLDLHTHFRQVKPQRKGLEVITIYNLLPQELHDGTIEMLNERYGANTYFSAGIHPWYLLPTTVDSQLSVISQYSKSPKVKVIGECGLDKLRGPEMEVQEAAFIQQIRMANEANKPLLIHCVRAYNELIKIRKSMDITVPTVIHGFNKSAELATTLIKHGFLLSFGKALLNEDSHAARSLVQTFESGHPVFLETDGSEYTIEDIYLKASNLLKVSTEQLKDAIFASWKSIGIYHD